MHALADAPSTRRHSREAAVVAALELALGEPAAAEVRTILEEAAGGEWCLVAADWMENMGQHSPLPIVRLALRLRAGEAISAEALGVSPLTWILAAHALVGELLRADRDRAERELAELQAAERRRRLKEGARRVRAALSDDLPPQVRADVLARLKRAQKNVDRRVRWHARRLAGPASARARRSTSRRRLAGGRCRSPGRPSGPDDPDLDGATLAAARRGSSWR
jgi:hypothetical protein